ncbi:MAG TPA: AAA family ATPase, partial [Edaphobacter sp.]|nr:AAA family ATPase [Edaphobacter sp.]
VTPDPGNLYASATHREALASLQYGINSGLGFVALIGQPGMGKTTLLFEILRQLRDKARTIFIFQTIVTPIDLLRAVLIELEVDETQTSLADMQAKLNQILNEQASTGKRVVVVIDEAQNLDDSVLELLRMLSNFETARDKLIQIVLSGQMQLGEKLAAPHLVQLRQRISIFARLEALSTEETSAYIDHRLRGAGYSQSAPLFTPGAVALIAKHSGGIPRNINNICFNALSLGCALERSEIGSDLIREVLKDLDLDTLRSAGEPAPTKLSYDEAAITRPVSRRMSAWKVAAAVCCLALPAASFSLGYYYGESAAQEGAATLQPPKNISLTPSAENATNRIGAMSTVRFTQSQPTSTRESLSSVPSPPSSIIANAVHGTRLIHVHAGQALYTICRNSLRKLGSDCVDKIQELNPSLLDPESLQRGQSILLPVAVRSEPSFR